MSSRYFAGPLTVCRRTFLIFQAFALLRTAAVLVVGFYRYPFGVYVPATAVWPFSVWLQAFTSLLYSNVNVNVVYALKQKFSEEGVGLCEDMGLLQPISELFTTDRGWAQVCRQRVPDDGGCNMEAPLAEPGPGPRNQHFTAFSRTEVYTPRDVSDRHTDVSEIGWAGAADTVKSSYGHLVKDPLA